MRTLILAFLAILITGGGGAAGYYYFKQPAEASVGETDEHQSANEAHYTEGTKGASGHEFVELEPLILPIVDQNGVSQIVSIVVVIEVDGGRDQEKVLKFEPRLKDAYIQELYGVLNRHAALKGGVIQVSEIKKRLAQISNKVMGEGVVQDVLLQVVQQRPI